MALKIKNTLDVLMYSKVICSSHFSRMLLAYAFLPMYLYPNQQLISGVQVDLSPCLLPLYQQISQIVIWRATYWYDQVSFVR